MFKLRKFRPLSLIRHCVQKFRTLPTTKSGLVALIACILIVIIIVIVLLGRSAEPKARLLLFTDLQYADWPNGWDSQKKYVRYFRGGMKHVEQAFEKLGISTYPGVQPNIDYVINVGDALHMKNEGRSKEKAISEVELLLTGLNVIVYNTIGHTDISIFGRKTIQESFLFSELYYLSPTEGIENKLCYYSITPFNGYKIVILDAYDVACVGRNKTDPQCKVMSNFLKMRKTDTENYPYYLQSSGGIGPAQLHWLEAELHESKNNEEKVIIITHAPMSPCCASQRELLLNWQQMLELVHVYADVVKMVISGHTQYGIHGTDDMGIHYLSLPPLVGAPPQENPAVILELTKRAMTVQRLSESEPYITIYNK